MWSFTKQFFPPSLSTLAFSLVKALDVSFPSSKLAGLSSLVSVRVEKEEGSNLVRLALQVGCHLLVFLLCSHVLQFNIIL